MLEARVDEARSLFICDRPHGLARIWIPKRFLLSTQIHTGRMTLAEDVNLEEFVMSKDELSGADIKAVCTEAGLLALRERRMRVS